MDNNPATPITLDSPAGQILERLAILGILDAEQFPELSRYARDQAVTQLTELGWIAILNTDGSLRAGRSGRAPLTYILTAPGAQGLQELGVEHARRYEQQNRVNQAHDICTLDVRFAAQGADLKVETERTLVDTPHVVRPDNAVTLTSGHLALFETEGPADAGQRARIIEKVINWHAAANALKQVKADLQVRVLFNVKLGPPLTNVRDLWAQSIAAAQSALKQPLAIQFWGQTLTEFMAAPTWDTLRGFTRLDDPARKAGFGLSPDEETKLDADFDALDLLPPTLRRQLIAYDDDRILLRAHARYFRHHLVDEIPRFSPEFFDLLREIHGAAFVTGTTHPLSIPAIALLMLRTYIRHHPDLQQALARAYRRFRATSSVLMAMRQAARLVNTFLDFHGLRHDHPGCRVWVTPPDLDGEQRSDFAVQVRLDVAWAEPDRDSRPTWVEFKDKTAEAMAWVLQQLIDYPQIVGIDEEAEKADDPASAKAHFRQPHYR